MNKNNKMKYVTFKLFKDRECSPEHSTVASMFPSMGKETLLNQTSTEIAKYYTIGHLVREQFTERFIESEVTSIIDDRLTLKNAPPLIRSIYIQHIVLLHWLRKQSSTIQWATLLDFILSADGRTYENAPVCYNFIVGSSPGQISLSDFDTKLLDPVGGGLTSFIRLDEDMKVVQVETTATKEHSNFSEALPDFSRSLHSILEEGEFLVSRIRCGDIVICNKLGMIASRRHNEWMLYQPHTLKSMINALVATTPNIEGPEITTTSLINILLKLSFMRHGALLIFDTNGDVLKKVKNRESILSNRCCDKGRQLLAKPLRGISIFSACAQYWQLLCELASIDGALIFDNTHITAFGALIPQNNNRLKSVGARTSAAYSAALHGGIAFKVSADGDVTIYIRSKQNDNAVIQFRVI